MGPHKHKKPYLRSYHHKLERNLVYVEFKLISQALVVVVVLEVSRSKSILADGKSSCMLELAIGRYCEFDQHICPRLLLTNFNGWRHLSIVEREVIMYRFDA